MRLQPNIRRGVFVTMVTLLYAVFFAAQLLSVSPDFPGRHHSIFVYGTQQALHQHKVGVASGYDHIRKDITSGIRINKRYLVSDYYFNIPVLSFANTVIACNEKPCFRFSQWIKDAPSTSTRSLRGPPATV